jgi:hypothetical protein
MILDLTLTQSRYIYSILDRAKMAGAKSISTPMTVSPTLSKHDGKSMPDLFLFRSIVGALQYVTITRPDIAFVVSQVSQFLYCPTLLHWSAVKRILRYLKGFIYQGIQLCSSIDLTLHAYSDLDWAGYPDDRKPTTRYLVFLSPNLISWCFSQVAYCCTV